MLLLHDKENSKTIHSEVWQLSPEGSSVAILKIYGAKKFGGG